MLKIINNILEVMMFKKTCLLGLLVFCIVIIQAPVNAQIEIDDQQALIANMPFDDDNDDVDVDYIITGNITVTDGMTLEIGDEDNDGFGVRVEIAEDVIITVNGALVVTGTANDIVENVEEKDVLINRTQMIRIAWQHNIRISRSTIHRWANKPDFPTVKGIDGQALLYSNRQFLKFIMRRLNRIQSEF